MRLLPLLALAVSTLQLHCAVDLSNMPGSAGMPPKPLECPTPPAKGFRPVRLGAWVSEAGTVLRVQRIGEGPELGEDHPGVQALRQWRFEPVLWEGKPIPFRVDVSLGIIGSSVVYQMAPLPNLPGENHVEGEFGLVMPSATIDPEPIIPLVEQASRASVDVAFEYVITPEGIPSEIKILGASSSTALSSGLNVLAGQQFTPGSIDGKPVRVAYKQVISISGTAPCPDGLYGLIEASDPIFPYDHLLSETPGSAKVKLSLRPDGSVASAEVLEASHEDFGLCLKACAESWLFSKESAAKIPVREYTHEFSLETLPGGANRIAKLLRSGNTIPNTAAGLDAKPSRTASQGLAYPPELVGNTEGGSAKIEFIIDRCGLAQTPRIIEASAPAFGWAAANWVGSMRFKPLTRNGIPTDLRLSVPVRFSAPKPENSATTAPQAAPAPTPATTAASAS